MWSVNEHVKWVKMFIITNNETSLLVIIVSPSVVCCITSHKHHENTCSFECYSELFHNW